MSPRKHWCKHCKKNFPSGRSLGGHMAMHRIKHKKQARATPISLPGAAADGVGRYGLRERRQKVWLDGDSGDGEEYFTSVVPRVTECQLCFKVFVSKVALSMHMRTHAAHREGKTVVEEVESREDDATVTSIGCVSDDDDAVVSAPVVLTYGEQEVLAARILMMLSGHSDACSPAAVEYCNEDCERGSNSEDCQVQESEMWLDCSTQGQFALDDEPMKPAETCSPDGRMRFGSLSNVLKATANHKCKLCSKVFESRRALGGHQKCHRVVPAHGKVQTSTYSAAAETGQHLIEADDRLIVLSLPVPGLGHWNGGQIGRSELNLWWGARSFRSERMVGVV